MKPSENYRNFKSVPKALIIFLIGFTAIGIYFILNVSDNTKEIEQEIILVDHSNITLAYNRDIDRIKLNKYKKIILDQIKTCSGKWNSIYVTITIDHIDFAFKSKSLSKNINFIYTNSEELSTTFSKDLCVQS